ncbi:hypothetical protein HUU59_03105 [bacterium]|nr:hypothetical protein [bacterium]
MKIATLTIIGLSLAISGSVQAMVGGPTFCVGNQVTSMTVEAERSSFDVPMESEASGFGGTESQRLFLSGRYGLTDFLDGQLKFGVANLDFNEFNNGFSPFSSSPSLAWGAGLKAGFPISSPLQINLGISYLGFGAEGDVTRSGRTVSNKYLWQEVQPSLTVGYRISEVTPYVGATKVYLTGKRDYKVSYNGEFLEAASGSGSYSDGEQPISPLVGLEWHLPDGYSVTGEASSGENGNWNVSIGLSQALR